MSNLGKTMLVIAQHRKEQFTGEHGHVYRQEAIVKFVLGCCRASADLKQLCEARRVVRNGVEYLEGAASSLEKLIADEFFSAFGHHLFPDLAPQESSGGTREQPLAEEG